MGILSKLSRSLFTQKANQGAAAAVAAPEAAKKVRIKETATRVHSASDVMVKREKSLKRSKSAPIANEGKRSKAAINHLNTAKRKSLVPAAADHTVKQDSNEATAFSNPPARHSFTKRTSSALLKSKSVQRMKEALTPKRAVPATQSQTVDIQRLLSEPDLAPPPSTALVNLLAMAEEEGLFSTAPELAPTKPEELEMLEFANRSLANAKLSPEVDAMVDLVCGALQLKYDSLDVRMDIAIPEREPRLVVCGKFVLEKQPVDEIDDEVREHEALMENAYFKIFGTEKLDGDDDIEGKSVSITGQHQASIDVSSEAEELVATVTDEDFESTQSRILQSYIQNEQAF